MINMSKLHTIKTGESYAINSFVAKLWIPDTDSHKGQNGKLLVIGGSDLFHAASLWSAEVASHFVDMVHYGSTEENNELFLALKKIFRNGIVVPRDKIDTYIDEDDVVLLGPGLERTDGTREITKEVLQRHPTKKFVIDAGSLQMMDPEWLKNLGVRAVITPHQKEFEHLFNQSIEQLSVEEKAAIVRKMANEYRCIIVMKAVVDIISDGEVIYVVEGGNAGLTKGGTGDILAGLIASLYSKNDSMTSCIIGSFVLKSSSEKLSTIKGTWYNNDDLIDQIPKTLFQLRSNS